MRTVIWTPVRPDITRTVFEAIHSQILAAGLPIISGGISGNGYILNFADDASDQQMDEALAIADAYDPVAASVARQAAHDTREADLRPFRQIQTLLDASVRDEAQVDGASLVQLRGLLHGLFQREQTMLKGMARLIGNLPISGGG